MVCICPCMGALHFNQRRPVYCAAHSYPPMLGPTWEVATHGNNINIHGVTQNTYIWCLSYMFAVWCTSDLLFFSFQTFFNYAQHLHNMLPFAYPDTQTARLWMLCCHMDQRAGRGGLLVHVTAKRHWTSWLSVRVSEKGTYCGDCENNWNNYEMNL